MPLKIIHVTPYFHPVVGGVELNVKHLCKHLIKLGHEVHVYTSNSLRDMGKIDRPEETIEGIHVRRFPVLFSISGEAKLWPTLMPKLLIEEYDVIHVHNYRHPHCDIALIASKARNSPCILSTRDPPPTGTPTRNLLSKLYDKTIAKLLIGHYDYIIVFSKKYENLMRSLGASRVEIIPNGVNPIFFNKGNPSKVRVEYDIPEKPTLLYVGRIAPLKGIENLLVGLSRILRIHDVILVIAGPPRTMEYLKKMRKLAERLGVQRKVYFIPRLFTQEELVDVYALGKIFLLLSPGEGLPTTLMEAMAQGLPVIATKIGGAATIVSHNVDGYLINPEDTIQLEKYVTSLLRDDALYKEISHNARIKAKKFDWNRIAKRIEKIYYMTIQMH